MSRISISPTPLTKHRYGENIFESEDSKFQEYRKRWEQQPLNFETGEFPLFIDLETTNVCNFKCTFCSNQFIPSEQFGFMEEDLVYKVIDEGKENGLYGLKFNVRGEPTLHKKLPDFVRYAVDAGLVDVYFNTNASRLTEELAVKVIEAGLTRITFSFEGYTKDYYERIRVNGDFDEIVGNIRRFHELRKKLGSSTPRIRISGVLLPEMKPYLSEYINFWGPYADQVSTNDWIQEDVNLHALPTKYKANWACATLWQRMAIWWDGTILPCNQDYLADDLRLGNLRDTTLKEAWLSPLHNKMRDAHKAGNSHLFDKCSTCSYRDQQISQYQSEMKVVAMS